MRWADSIKGATGLSLQELSRDVTTGHCGCHAFIELSGVGADNSMYTHTSFKDGYKNSTISSKAKTW